MLTDEDREALIDALRAYRNNEHGRQLRVVTTADAIVRRHRAAALREAAAAFKDQDWPAEMWDGVDECVHDLEDRANQIERGEG